MRLLMEPECPISEEGGENNGLNDSLFKTMNIIIKLIDCSDSDDIHEKRKVNKKDEILKFLQEANRRITEKETNVKEAREQSERLQKTVKKLEEECTEKTKGLIDLQKELEKCEKGKNEEEIKLNEQNDLVIVEELDLAIFRDKIKNWYKRVMEIYTSRITKLEDKLRAVKKEMDEFKVLWGESVRSLKISVNVEQRLEGDFLGVMDEVEVTTTTENPTEVVTVEQGNGNLQELETTTASTFENSTLVIVADDDLNLQITTSYSFNISTDREPGANLDSTESGHDITENGQEAVGQEDMALQDQSPTSQKRARVDEENLSLLECSKRRKTASSEESVIKSPEGSSRQLKLSSGSAEVKHGVDIFKRVKNDAYLCFCNEEFKTRQELNLHIRENSKKIFTCPDCPEMFKNVGQLQRHVKRDHNKKSFSRHGCYLCGAFFQRKTMLIAHKKSHNL